MVRTEFDGLYLELSCHLWDCLPGCRRANILTWKLTKAVAKLQHAAPLLWVHHTPRAGVVSLLVHKHCVHILLQQRSCKARTYYALSATEPERQPNAPAVKSARTTTKLLQKRSVFSRHYIDVLQIQLAIPYYDEAAAAAAVLLAAAAVSSGHEPSVQMPPSK